MGFFKKLFRGAKKLFGGVAKGVGKAFKGFAKNPLKALIRSPLKVGLPLVGAALLAGQLFKRKKIKPEVPPHIAELQQGMLPLAQGLLGYASGALSGGIYPTEFQLAGQQAGLASQLGGQLPLLGSFLGGALAGGGMTGLRGLRGFLDEGETPIFERPEYQDLFDTLREQSALAMEETASPILSRLQAMGMGQSSAAVGELARAQERIMEDLHRQLAGIGAQAFEAERGRQFAAAERLYGGIPTVLDLVTRGGLEGLQALQAGQVAAGLPRQIAMAILGTPPLPEAYLATGTYPYYAPSVGEQLLGGAGQLAAIYEILRRGRRG